MKEVGEVGRDWEKKEKVVCKIERPVKRKLAFF